MKKIFPLLFLLFSTYLAWSQDEKVHDNDSIIEWNENYHLRWVDFKSDNKNSLNIKGHSYNAVSSVELSVFINFDHSQYKFVVYARFHKYNSYVSSRSEKLLIHEQKHFDIYEIFARKLRKVIELRKHEENFVDYFENLYVEFKSRLDDYSRLYDEETKHSKNEKKQDYWNDKIQKELNELEEYSFNKFNARQGRVSN